jgi:hypothetical protein
MHDTMKYAGKTCEYTLLTVRGETVQVPHISMLVRGEHVGDVALIDGDEFRRWDGTEWSQITQPL